MGMYSWECKGCHQELKMDEEVRLNGCRGVYDGYGGAGGFSFDLEMEEPVAWHLKCYREATPEQKLDEKPSKFARNQGFGDPNPEFLP